MVTRIQYLALTMVFISLIGIIRVVEMPPLLVYNKTTSMPLGFYWIWPGSEVRVGDIVLVRLPDDIADLAHQRSYLSKGVPLLKKVIASEGDRVCRLKSAIYLNGRMIASAHSEDRLGRSLPTWSGCTTLTSRQVFLLSGVSSSFDSRYFGPVLKAQIIGCAMPVLLTTY